MKRLFIMLALLTYISAFASQQRVSISRGFFIGKEYFDMSDTEKRAYATGAINGMLLAPFFGAPEERLNWLKICSAQISDEQTASIIGNYINSDSSRQSMNLNVITFNALKEACDKMR